MKTFLHIIAWLLKLFLKLILLPVIIVLTLAQWVSIVAVGIASAVFDLIGGFLIISGILIYAFGLYPASDMWEMVIAGVVLCIIPLIGEWAAVQITYINLLAKHWLMT